MIYMFCSVLLFLIRAALVVRFFFMGTATALVLGGSGLVSLLTTCVAWGSGRPDLSLRGVGIGAAYLVPLLFIPSGSSSDWSAFLVSTMFGLQLLVRFYLGRCCTITGPVFVMVKHCGPYRIVRHPLTAVEWLLCWFVVLGSPSVWNCIVLLVCCCVKVWTVINEERFLCGFAEYRAYTKSVGWRLCPYVW